MKKSLGAKPIAYPTPVFLVGTYSEDDTPNIMTVAWGGICCSSPPSLAVSLRSATLSHSNIVRSKAFTVNVTSRRFVRQSDYAGIFSGKSENKFESLGLTPTKAEFVNAPYIEEYPVVLECELSHTIEIGLHTQFIGEIKDVKVDVSLLREDDVPDVASIDPILFAPLSREYYAVGDYVGKAFSVGKTLKE